MPRAVVQLPDGRKAVVELPYENQSKIGEPKYASALDRFKLSFGDARGREKYLQERGIAEENVNKPGLDLGDITSKAGGAIPAILSTLGTGVGATAGGLVAAPTVAGVPLGVAGGAVAGSTAGAAAGEGLRQTIGNVMGVQANPGGREQAGDIAREATAGAISVPLGSATSRIGLKYLAKQPEKLFRRALKLSRSTVDKMADKGIKVGDLIDLGKFGSLDSLAGKADEIVKETMKLKSALLEKSNDVVKVDTFITKLFEAADEARNVGDQARHDALVKFADNYDAVVSRATKGTYQMTVQAAEAARKKVSQALGNKFLQDSSVKEGQRTVQDIYKEVLEEAIPDVAALNKRIRTAMELKNLATAASKTGGSMASQLARTMSTVAGGTVAGMVGGPGAIGPGILAALGVTMASQSPIARTVRAQAIRKAGQVASKIAPVVRPAGSVLLRQFLSQ